MMDALVYLTACSVKNRIAVRLRRLREPRYLLGTIAGLFYFYSVFLRPRRGSPAGMWPRIAGGDGLEVAGAVVLFVIAAIAWIWPGSGKPALAFSRAEVQFLFTAPLTRRRLIVYRVLRSQLGAFGGSAIVTLLVRPGRLAAGWTFFLGMSLLMTTLNLHLIGVSLSRESLGRHGLAGLARQWLPVAAVLGVVAAIAVPVALDWTHLTTLARGSDAVRELHQLITTGAAGLALWPFRAVTRLPLAATPQAFFAALPAVLLIVGVNFVWVLRSDAAFEEASAELSERIATRGRGQPALTRARRMPTPFTLALTGRPEMAVLWKNLILLGRYASLRTLLVLLPLTVSLGLIMSTARGHQSRLDILGVVCLSLAFMTVVIGPMMVRNDLRQDLASLAVLKTWPVRGAALVRGETLAPILVLSALVWLLMIGAVALSSRSVFGVLFSSAAERLSALVASLLLAPGVIATQVVAQNGLAVLFPAWVSIGPSRPHGTEVMGQRLIVLAGMLLVLVVAILPAAILGGVAAWLVFLATRAVPIVIPAAIATTVLLAECLLGTEAIGAMLDRTDIAAVDAIE